MKLNKRKILIGISIAFGIILMILGGAIWYIEPIATKYLNDNANSLLNQNPKSPYTYEVGEIELAIWEGGFHVADFKISPKDSTVVTFTNGELNSLMSIRSKAIFLTGFKIYELYKTGNLTLNKISITSPEINYRINPEIKDTIAKTPLRDIIKNMGRKFSVNEISFDNMSITLNNDFQNPESAIFIDSLHFVIEQLHLSPQTADMDLPFQVKDIFIQSESVNYQINDSTKIDLKGFHTSLIKEDFYCHQLNLVSNNHSIFKMDSLSIEGIDLAKLIDSSQFHLNELDLFGPTISLKEEKKKKKASSHFHFESFFQIPISVNSLNIINAEVQFLENPKNGLDEKLNISDIDLKIRGLSNIKVDSITGKKVQIDTLKFRCNPQLTFKDSRSGESKELSIDKFELDIEGLKSDSVLFNSDLVTASNFYRLDFSKLKYDVSNTAQIQISGFEMDKFKEIIHLGKVQIRRSKPKKGENKLALKADKVDIHGVNLKSILTEGQINLKKIIAMGVHLNMEQWEKKPEKRDSEIDFNSFIGVPVNVKKMQFLKADFYLKTHLLDTQIEEMKIADVDIHISDLGNIKTSKAGRELGLNKLVLDCKPRIMLMDSLGEIDKVLLMDDLKIELEHIYTTRNIINTPLPIRVDDYSLDFGGLIYNLDDFYTLKVGDIQFNKLKKKLTFDKVSVRSKYKKREHVERMAIQTEWMDVNIKSINVLGLDIKEILTEQQFNADQILLNNINLELLRDKNYDRPPFKEKALPVKSLLNVTLPINIPNIKVNNLSLVYQEIPEGKRESGQINFSNLHCDIKNVTNIDDKIKNNDKMTLDLTGTFMEDISLKTKYTFNLSDASKPFTLEGEVKSFGMTQLDQTMYKLVGVGINSGQVSWVKFWMEADNESSTGWYDMYYENFKVESELKKDFRILGIRTNWLLTGAANAIILPSNTNVRKFRRGIIQTDRMKDRSIFNYSWHSLKTGIMSSMGLKKHKKIELD